MDVPFAIVFSVTRLREINLHPDVGSAFRSTAGRPYSIRGNAIDLASLGTKGGHFQEPCDLFPFGH